MNAILAPVIHGISRDDLRANCDAIRRVNDCPQSVCIGGLVPLLRESGQLGPRRPDARRRLEETINLVRGSFPASGFMFSGLGRLVLC